MFLFLSLVGLIRFLLSKLMYPAHPCRPDLSSPFSSSRNRRTQKNGRITDIKTLYVSPPPPRTKRVEPQQPITRAMHCPSLSLTLLIHHTKNSWKFILCHPMCPISAIHSSFERDQTPPIVFPFESVNWYNLAAGQVFSRF